MAEEDKKAKDVKGFTDASKNLKDAGKAWEKISQGQEKKDKLFGPALKKNFASGFKALSVPFAGMIKPVEALANLFMFKQMKQFAVEKWKNFQEKRLFKKQFDLSRSEFKDLTKRKKLTDKNEKWADSLGNAAEKLAGFEGGEVRKLLEENLTEQGVYNKRIAEGNFVHIKTLEEIKKEVTGGNKEQEDQLQQAKDNAKKQTIGGALQAEKDKEKELQIQKHGNILGRMAAGIGNLNKSFVSAAKGTGKAALWTLGISLAIAALSSFFNSEAWKNIKKWFMETGMPLLEELWEGIKWLGDKLWNTVNILWGGIKEQWDNIMTLFDDLKEAFNLFGEGKWHQGFVKLFQGIGNYVLKTINTLTTTIYNIIAEWLGWEKTDSVGASIKNFITDLAGNIKQFFIDFKDWIVAKLKLAWDNIKKKFTKMFDWIPGVGEEKSPEEKKKEKNAREIAKKQEELSRMEEQKKAGMFGPGDVKVLDNLRKELQSLQPLVPVKATEKVVPAPVSPFAPRALGGREYGPGPDLGDALGGFGRAKASSISSNKMLEENLKGKIARREGLIKSFEEQEKAGMLGADKSLLEALRKEVATLKRQNQGAAAGGGVNVNAPTSVSNQNHSSHTSILAKANPVIAEIGSSMVMG